MEFRLDETQQAIAGLARDTLRRATPEAAAPDAEAIWKAMAQAGLLSLCLPERLGGDGLGMLEVALVLREVGRRTAPVPALTTLGLGALMIARHGTPEQQNTFLPPVAAGESLLTAALREPGRPGSEEPETTARRDGDGFVVDGMKPGVPYARQARRVLVPVRTGTETAVLLIHPHADGVTLTPSPASGDTPEYTMRLAGVRTGERLGDAATALDLHRHATAAIGATLDGVVEGALELTTEHVKTRHQFGRPLATFQAVAERIAEVYIASRTLNLAATSATWRLAEGLDADTDLEVLAYWATERGPRAMQSCHHLHGGLGMDISYPLHRHYAWAKDLARMLGGPAYRLDRIGTPAAP